MSDFVIKVENLGKKYKIRHQQPERSATLRDIIANGVRCFRSKVVGGIGLGFQVPG